MRQSGSLVFAGQSCQNKNMKTTTRFVKARYLTIMDIAKMFQLSVRKPARTSGTDWMRLTSSDNDSSCR